jgi:amidase
MLSDKTTAELVQIKPKSEKQVFNFETPMVKYQLDAILSINNNSGHAAAANYYPCLRSLWVTKQQENHGDLPYSQTLSRRCPLKMGFAFEKQPNQKIT